MRGDALRLRQDVWRPGGGGFIANLRPVRRQRHCLQSRITASGGKLRGPENLPGRRRVKSGKQKELVLGDAGAQRDPKTFSTGRTASSDEQRRQSQTPAQLAAGNNLRANHHPNDGGRMGSFARDRLKI